MPPSNDEWRHCCHQWDGQIMTYREVCQRKFTCFFCSLSVLDYSLTFIGFPLVSGSIHNHLPGNYLQMPVFPALQKSIATRRTSGRFENGCASNNLGRPLNPEIYTAFISRLYCWLFFIVLWFYFAPLVVPQPAMLTINTLQCLVSLRAGQLKV